MYVLLLPYEHSGETIPGKTFLYATEAYYGNRLQALDLSGIWDEIWRSLESIEFFDLDKAVKYAVLLGNAPTEVKAGFFLEQHREHLLVEEHHLKLLHDMQPRQPHYLDRTKRKSVCLVSKWNHYNNKYFSLRLFHKPIKFFISPQNQ